MFQKLVLRKNTSDMGILGSILRWGVLLAFAVYFVVPMLWLLLAPSKDTTQLFHATYPLAFGSWDRVIKSWQNVTSYQNGEVLLWFENSVKYAALSLLGSLAISIPAGYMLAIKRFPGRSV